MMVYIKVPLNTIAIGEWEMRTEEKFLKLQLHLWTEGRARTLIAMFRRIFS